MPSLSRRSSFTSAALRSSIGARRMSFPSSSSSSNAHRITLSPCTAAGEGRTRRSRSRRGRSLHHLSGRIVPAAWRQPPRRGKMKSTARSRERAGFSARETGTEYAGGPKGSASSAARFGINRPVGREGLKGPQSRMDIVPSTAGIKHAPPEGGLVATTIVLFDLSCPRALMNEFRTRRSLPPPSWLQVHRLKHRIHRKDRLRHFVVKPSS